MASYRWQLDDETATLALGAELGKLLCGGMTVYLHGNLGAGKTTLTRGMLRGLGYTERVKSPTYTLVEPYVVSNLYFHHFDLYRFADPYEWSDAGFRDLFNSDSVCVVEWPDKAGALLPSPDWQISLEPYIEGRLLTLRADSSLGQQCLKLLTLPPVV